jgi:hypothetical protein
MPHPISTYALYGLNAIPTDVIVEGDIVRVVEVESGWILTSAIPCWMANTVN